MNATVFDQVKVNPLKQYVLLWSFLCTVMSEESDEDDIVSSTSEGSDEDNIFPGIPFSKASFDRCPHTMNILLLGETNIGKTTFVNNFPNLLSFSDIAEAANSRFHVLAPVSFTCYDSDNNRKEIFVPANVNTESLADDNNEDLTRGHSATQAPRSYLFSWGPSLNKKFIRLIDTPGIRSTFDLMRDIANRKAVLEFVIRYKEIHAICILLTPSGGRLTTSCRYVIEDIFSNLPLAAKQNIMFCFTFSRHTCYRPGETWNHLEHMLQRMKNTIQLNGNNTFCFDSDSFRYLCAQKCDVKYNSKEKEGFQRSFLVSKRELFSRTEPYKMDETPLLVDNIRGLIMSHIGPMAEISNSLVSSNGLKEEQIRELKEDEARVNEIWSSLNSRSGEAEQRELENAAERMKSAREFIANLEAKINDLEERKQAILAFRTEAIAFIRMNIFFTVNDALVNMFDWRIKYEIEYIPRTNYALITELTLYRDQYQEYAQWIKQHVEDGTHRVKTTTEMSQLIEEMRSRPRIRTLFTNVEELQAMQGREQPEDAARLDLLQNYEWPELEEA